MDNILKVRNLSVGFLNKNKKIEEVVLDVTFNLEKGKRLGIVGESGSGKTLTILSILKLLDENAKILNGDILFKNKNIVNIEEKELKNIRGKQISIIFQDPMSSLNPLIKVGKQILENLHDIKLEKSLKKEMVLKIMEEVLFKDPESIYNYYPHQLSGGMRQRIMIASAIIRKPDILIADEPTTSLDASIQNEIIKIINNLTKNNNMSTIFVSHDLSVINNVSDYVAVMYKGYLLEFSTTYDIINKPLHPYTKKLISSILNRKNKESFFKSINKGDIIQIKNIKLCPFLDNCKYAKGICFEEMPKYEKIDNNKFIRCFKYKELI